MTKINDNLYVNKAQIISVVKSGSEYYIVLATGQKLYITEELYNQLKETE